MKSPPSRHVPASKWNPVLIGSALGLFSAAVYTCTNICLREVARSDPFWVSCIKALPTLLLASGLLVYRRVRGQSSWPGWPVLGLLMVTGLTAQVVGNVGFQYALGIVGIALSVPLTFGTLMLSGAMLGRWWLKEPITPRAGAAMTLLVAAIAILSTGARAAEEVVESGLATAHSPWQVVLGVGAACISGVAYGLLGVVLRRVTPAKASLGATLFVISGVGTVSLGLWSLSRLGWSGILATSAADFSYMCWAGVFNAVAFVALIQALSIAPLVHVNAVNSSQTALAAMAGILIFGEPLTYTLALGVGMTTAGLLLLDHREKADKRFTDPSDSTPLEKDFFKKLRWLAKNSHGPLGRAGEVNAGAGVGPW